MMHISNERFKELLARFDKGRLTPHEAFHLILAYQDREKDNELGVDRAVAFGKAINTILSFVNDARGAAVDVETQVAEILKAKEERTE